MKLLICIDGSQHSEAAVDQVCTARWPSDSEVRIATVIEAQSDVKQQKAAADMVMQAADRIRRERNGELADVRGFVLRGYAKEEVLWYVEEWQPDLLVAGSRGHKGIKRMLLGSVSHSLLLAAECSVRIVRSRKNSAAGAAQRVLIAVEDSIYSNILVDEISARAWSDDTEFLCVNSVPSLAELVHEDQNSHAVSVLEEKYAETRALSQRLLERTVRTLQDKVPHVKCEYEILEGDPRETIVEISEQWSATLVMTGCRGKQLLDRIFIGSVSEAIATWANCSVEVVKKPPTEI